MQVAEFRHLKVLTANSTGDFTEELVLQYRSRLADLSPDSAAFSGWGPWTSVPVVTEAEADEAAAAEAAVPFDLNAYAQSRVGNAIRFGKKLGLDFAATCLLQGINKSPQLASVTAIMNPIKEVMDTGGLVQALQLLHALPLASYDETFITPAKVLAMVNDIEVFIGLPESEHLASGVI